MIPSEPEDRDVLAGEYVLGLLDAAATADIERALDSDADLARRVTFWEKRLLPVSAVLGTVEVDPEQWARIEQDLATRRHALVRTTTLPPLRPRRAMVRAAWRNPTLWRTTTALATAAAILLAILPSRLSAPAESPPRYFAILQARDATGQESGAGWLIQIARNGTLRSLPLTDVQPGSGRALQLWTLWAQARGPVSLGVLPPGGEIRLPPERLEAIGDGQLFEITLEPEGGSPIGRPTGRILFIGRAKGATAQSL